ncbi:MAG: MBL fold metallo-hydrolase [Trueperaceae bacterium]
MAPQFRSEHFRIEQIGDGVWAAIHQPGGWAVGNAGIVDLGDATLVFDATITPEAGADLRQTAVALTGRAPDYVALSHYHNDHVRGAQSFPDAVLVSSEATRSLIGTLGRDELASDLAHGRAQLAQARAHASSENAKQRAFGAAFVPYWEALIATAPRVSVRLPDLTFGDRAAWHGSRRTAEITSLGAAHTPDDAILYLPDDGIVFCGDLLFVASHPYLADGEPEGWLAALERMTALDARVFVPGHGPIGSKGSLAVLVEHIQGLLAEAERLRRERVAPDIIETAMPNDESVSWEFAFPFYRANLRFLVGRER